MRYPGVGAWSHLPVRDEKIFGVVLAGGESGRFGKNKALFTLSGKPMAAWALEALSPHFPRCVTVANDPAVAEALQIPGRQDRIPGLGPLGGLATALEWAREEGMDGVFFLACDLPLVGPALVERILVAWPLDALAVVPGSHGPLGMEPLCAGYRVGGLRAVEKASRSPNRSMMMALTQMGAHRIPPSRLGTPAEISHAFTNVNTPEEALRVRLSPAGNPVLSPRPQASAEENP